MRSQLATVALLAAGLAQAAPNLLVNPGAEDGPAGWGGNCQHVTTPGAAHSGGGCFQGTVDRPNDHRRLTQRVLLEGELPYEVTLWARSDNGCQVVLWLERNGQRLNVGRWENTPAQWRQCRTVFSVPEGGEWEVQFIVPSSHGGAPLGTAWVDDLSLTLLAAGRPTRLSEPDTIADQLSLAAGPDGIWAAWELFGADRDQLVVAHLDTGPPPQVDRSWTLDFGARTYTLWPRFVGGLGGLWLVSAVERDARWDVVAVPVAADGPGRPIWVTADEPTDLQVVGALDGRLLRLAWSSSIDGARRLRVATVADGRVEPPLTLPEPGAYNPALTVGGGRVWLVYDRFVDGNRDLWLRSYDGTAWSEPRRLTHSNRHDANPAPVWWRDRLWVAWECSTHGGYNISSVDTKTVMLAASDEAGLVTVPGLETGVPGRFVEEPKLVVDAADRLWLAVGQARGSLGRDGWDTRVVAYSGAAWGEWQQVSGMPGRAREPALVATGDGVLVGHQADGLQPSYPTKEAAARIWSRVECLPLAAAAAPPAAELVTTPYPDRDDPAFNAAAERVRMGEDRGRFTFDHHGRTLVGYFGNFHEHSDISVCRRAQDQRVEEDYTTIREVGRFDFGAVTDHGYNIAPNVWRYSAKVTRASHDPTRFVTFVAEEWTSDNERHTKPPGYYGHRNLIFADPFYPTWLNSRDPATFTPQQVWDTLGDANYIMIPHQLADSGNNVPIDWSYVDERRQPVAEIFQARESYEADDAPRRTKNGWPGYFLQDVWARGVRIGVIASPDHGGGRGKAGVLAEELTREKILDACRARHTWGTSAAKIALAVTVDGHLMGDIVPAPATAPVRVRVVVSGAGPLAAVRVIRNNRVVHSVTDEGPEVSFEYLDNAPLAEDSYYYVRVEQRDGELAWSSPVWLDREG